MKKIKLSGKLNLNKAKVASLSNDQMNNVKGGFLTISKSRRNSCAKADEKTNCKSTTNPVYH